MLAIYLPNTRTANESTLKSLGCGELFDRHTPPSFATDPGPGPDGGEGLIAHIARFDTDVRALVAYHNEAQSWYAAPAGKDRPAGAFWLGWWSDCPPGPVELARENVVDGLPVTMADGRSWTVPIADYCPTRLTIDPDTGADSEEFQDKYLPFIKRANEIFAHFMSDGFQQALAKNRTFTVPDGLTFAAEALAVNYRITRELVDALALVGQFEAAEVARVATGMQAVADMAQKKTPRAAYTT